MEIHKHHIIPVYHGEEIDITIIVTREEHALLHLKLWKIKKNKKDLCAYYMLTHDIENFRSIYGHLGGTRTQELRKEQKLTCYGLDPQSFKHLESCSKGGKVQGKRNAETGHMYEIQKLSNCSEAGKLGAEICRERKVNAFFDPKLRKDISSKGGKVQGKRNAETGHLKRIAQLPNKRNEGMIWINNGSNNKMIKKNVLIPEGWMRGKLQRKKEK